MREMSARASSSSPVRQNTYNGWASSCCNRRARRRTCFLGGGMIQALHFVEESGKPTVFACLSPSSEGLEEWTRPELRVSGHSLPNERSHLLIGQRCSRGG